MGVDDNYINFTVDMIHWESLWTGGGGIPVSFCESSKCSVLPSIIVIFLGCLGSGGDWKINKLWTAAVDNQLVKNARNNYYLHHTDYMGNRYEYAHTKSLANYQLDSKRSLITPPSELLVSQNGSMDHWLDHCSAEVEVEKLGNLNFNLFPNTNRNWK